MSAPRLALESVPPGPQPADSRFSLPWLARFTLQCAALDCRLRGKLWPSWLRRSSGVVFESQWYCGVDCLRSALAFRAYRLLAGFQPEQVRPRRLPLGLILIERGLLSPGQLRCALQRQRLAGFGRIGYWLRELGFLTEEQVTAGLAQQWGCPLFPLGQQPSHASWAGLLPFTLLESARAVPAYTSPDRRSLHLAFCERIDHTLLYAVDHMLGCRSFACVASESSVQRSLELFRRSAVPEETCFDTLRDPAEMTWTICSYAGEIAATRLVIVRAAAYIWVRFWRGDSARDLLFRILPAAPAFPEKFPVAPKVPLASADRPIDSASGVKGEL